MKNVDREDRFILDVQTYILDNLESPEMNGDTIGDHFGISRMQLHRKLKALTNKSTSQYIREIRLSKAVELMQETNFNISEVAYKTGFSSPSQFSRVFKEKYGVPPSQV